MARSPTTTQARGVNPISFHGLDAVALRSPDGASLVVTLQGAQVVSWIPANDVEQLFVSERNSFAPAHPIRGGVPVVFPQFSKRGPLPQHGFARTRNWTLASQGVEGGEAHATFTLESSGDTLALWPHDFAAKLAVTFAANHLEVELGVRNSGQESLAFTAALHTYLHVSDVSKARLEGLSGLRYEEDGIPATDGNAIITAEGPVDRIYFRAPEMTRLVDGARAVVISQEGFRDTVVWNPGREKTLDIADMEPTGYRNMLCVESAVIESPVQLRSGDAWTGLQRLEVMR
jgi:glucose-6-phosphate 1-epimerase